MNLEVYGNDKQGWSGSYEQNGVDARLAACPFCGGSDVELMNTHSPSYWVECQGCEAQGPHGRSDQHDGGRITKKAECEQRHRDAMQDAITRWNKRG